MKDLFLVGLAFPFGLLAETFARITLWIHDDFDMDFNYLKSKRK